MCVGLIDHKRYSKGQAKGVGNIIMAYVGAKTGRDGIHGATFCFRGVRGGRRTAALGCQVGEPLHGKIVIRSLS